MTEAADTAPTRSWGHGLRPVLALHCALAHSGAWAGLAQRVEGVTLTASDHPGHGRDAGWDGVQDFHALATAQATAIARRLAAGGRIDLFGHSFGGTVALRIALENPGLVRSLMLVEPVLFAAARETPAYAEMSCSQVDLPVLIVRDREEAATRFHAEWGGGEALSDLPERQRRYITDRIHLIPAANPALMQDNARMLRPGGLEGLEMPVLLVEGAESPGIVGAIHDALATRLPRVSRLVVPGAGHMVPITHPGAMAPAVQAHLDAG